MYRTTISMRVLRYKQTRSEYEVTWTNHRSPNIGQVYHESIPVISYSNGRNLGLWLSTTKGTSLLEPSPLPFRLECPSPQPKTSLKEHRKWDKEYLFVQVGCFYIVSSYMLQMCCTAMISPHKEHFSVSLAQDSGLVALGLVGETTEYVFLSPQKLYQDTLDEPGIESTSETYSLSMTESGVFIEPKHIQLTKRNRQYHRIMTAAQQSSITALSFVKEDGTILFKENFATQQSYSMSLTATFVIIGGVLGACISLSYGAMIPYMIRLFIGCIPIFICLGISHHAMV